MICRLNSVNVGRYLGAKRIFAGEDARGADEREKVNRKRLRRGKRMR